MFRPNPVDDELDALIQSGYQFKASDTISKGWKLLNKDMAPFVAFMILLSVIHGVASALSQVIHPLFQVVELALMAPLVAGMYIAARKLDENAPIRPVDLFKGFHQFFPLFLAALVTSVGILIGYFLLLIPGVYLQVAWLLVTPFIIFRKKDIWQAMESSRRLITKNFGPFLGFGFLLILINLLGLLICGLGLWFTIPLTICSIYVAYEEVLGQIGKAAEIAAAEEEIDSGIEEEIPEEEDDPFLDFSPDEPGADFMEGVEGDRFLADLEDKKK